MAQVEFLTTDRILGAFFRRFIKGEKSEFIDDDGNVLRKPDYTLALTQP